MQGIQHFIHIGTLLMVSVPHPFMYDHLSQMITTTIFPKVITKSYEEGKKLQKSRWEKE